MKSGIYTITNTVNNKMYVGYSSNVSRRIYQHKRFLKLGQHPNAHLQFAFNQYGETCFEFDVLEYYENIDVLPSMENYWINILQCRDRLIGYNIASTSDRSFPLKMDLETKEKLIKRFKEGGHPALGRKLSEETKRQMSISRKGKKLSEEQRNRMSEYLKKAWTDERRKRFSDYRKGKKHSDETKAILSASAKKRTGVNGSNYGNVGSKNPLTKKVIDVSTGVIYDSVKEASAMLGCSYRSLRPKLGGSRQNDTTMVYLDNYKQCQ